jgi:hypothetical protein
MSIVARRWMGTPHRLATVATVETPKLFLPRSQETQDPASKHPEPHGQVGRSPTRILYDIIGRSLQKTIHVCRSGGRAARRNHKPPPPGHCPSRSAAEFGGRGNRMVSRTAIAAAASVVLCWFASTGCSVQSGTQEPSTPASSPAQSQQSGTVANAADPDEDGGSYPGIDARRKAIYP